jgi:hypothetical protein
MDAYTGLAPEALLSLAEVSGADILITGDDQAGPAGWTAAFRNRQWTAWRRP